MEELELSSPTLPDDISPFVVIGGKAMQCHGFRRYTSDLDGWLCEGHTLPLSSTPPLIDITTMPLQVFLAMQPHGTEGYASLDDLLTIKLSHLVYDIFWWKHLQDYLLLKKTGAKLNEKLYKVLCKHWGVEFSSEKSKLSLYKSRDEFFDDFVVKKFEHDWLHELVAGEEVPVYTTCLKGGQEVLVDREKFIKLPLEQQVRMFKEEMAVIALERWVIPTKGRIPICHAWNKSLHKVVTALTKGWASRFIVENIEEFLSPLGKDMERVLTILGIGGKEMNFDDFKEMLVGLAEWDDLSDWYKNRYTPDDGDKDEYAQQYYCFDEIIHGGLEGKVEILDQDGGGEGGSENCYSVLKIGDTLYKVWYRYYSHHGYEFDGADVTIVKPVQKVVTVYE